MPANRPWTNAEDRLLTDLWQQEYEYRTIAQYLPGRSWSAVKRRLLHQRRVARGLGPSENLRHTNYRVALSPADWPEIQWFLYCLSRYAEVVQRCGAKPDVSAFMKTYVQEYGSRRLSNQRKQEKRNKE